jgi:acetyl-CoA C-acetyltransferase
MIANNKVLRPVAVVGGVRLPFCRQGTQYGELSTLDMLTEAMRATVEHFGLKGQVLGDVALGTTFYPPSTWNLAREAVLKSGLDPRTPAMGVQRACGTSLDAAIVMAQKIASGHIEAGIAGGSESASNITLFYRPGLSRAVLKMSQAKTIGDRIGAWRGISANDFKPGAPAAVEPSSGKSMGQHCEMMAKEWKISREAQDELALRSHTNGVAAFQRGFYKDLVRPFQGVERDNNLRADTSLEKMGKLKPSFDKTAAGTLTAGNSSPLTDGAACVVLASEAWAKERGLPVLAYLTDFDNAAIDLRSEGLLMAPAYAVSTMLQRNKLALQAFDFYEIHEAFAAQVLCTLKAWESADFCRSRLGREAALGAISRDKLNVAGGSVALGHPFGATGARMVATLAKLLSEKGSGKGLLSICTGGGMGTVAILER